MLLAGLVALVPCSPKPKRNQEKPARLKSPYAGKDGGRQSQRFGVGRRGQSKLKDISKNR
jgi:hypothetical protein